MHIIFYNIYNSAPVGSEMPESIDTPNWLYTFVLVKDPETNTYKIYTDAVAGDDNYLGATSKDTGKFVNESGAFSVKVKYTNDGETVNLISESNERILGINTNANSMRACWYSIGTGTTTDLSLIPVNQPAEFPFASLNGGVDLSLLYFVSLAEGEDIADYAVRFTHGEKVVTVDSYTELYGHYIFAYTGITPQCMGDAIKAEILKGEDAVAVKPEFSVKQYAAEYKEKFGESAFIDKLLVYGAAAQVYTGYNTENLVTELVLPEGEYDKNDTLRDTTDNTDEDYRFTAAGMRFDYVNRLYVDFTAESLEGVTVKFNDYAVTEFVSLGGGKYRAYSDAISLTDLNQRTTITISVGENVLSTIDYNACAYIEAKWKSDAPLGNLVKALYFCSEEAEKLGK